MTILIILGSLFVLLVAVDLYRSGRLKRRLAAGGRYGKTYDPKTHKGANYDIVDASARSIRNQSGGGGLRGS